MSKPFHLSRFYAEQFQERSVVDAYAHRPPIPDPVIEILLSLIVDAPRRVLDAGCGTGAVASRLAPLVDYVDAVDFSGEMIATGQQLPHGDHPHLRWVKAAIEDAELVSPYALIVAAGSLHWMEWEIVMPRFRSMLTPNGVLAVVWQSEVRQEWHTPLYELIRRYSTNQYYQSYNLIEELTRRNLFHQRGKAHTPPSPFRQSVASYVESIHSRNGFSRQRMAPEEAQVFDQSVMHLLSEVYPAGTVELKVVGHVVWGDPAPS